MKKIIALAALGLILLTFGFYSRHRLGTEITIRGHSFNVELAVTQNEKEKGLGDRDKLDENSGMLFVYDHPDKYTFWMKGMRLPLDFIWINGVKVVDVTQNVPNLADGRALSTYAPKVPADKIFEVNSGMVAKYGIAIGDIVKISE